MDKATADSLYVQSFAIIKNTGHGNFVIIRLRLACAQWPPLPQTPVLRFLLWGGGGGGGCTQAI